ncbi:MAG: transcriptional repressor [Phycisphaeraceae bacterium]|nr:transcriptional repressor [Phycisphaeraceae bacterium]
MADHDAHHGSDQRPPVEAEAIAALFARRGLRVTRQRQEVYAALAATTAHPTAEELHRLVLESPSVDDTEPPVSLATVYNTLEALTDSGLVRKIPTPEGGARYDADTTDHMHLMTGAGRVHDVPADLGQRFLEHIPESLVRELEQRMGVTVRRVSVSVLADDRPSTPE